MRGRTQSTPARRTLQVGLLLTSGSLLCAGTALASNGSKLRTPVVFQDQPCLTVLERGSGASTEIDISVAMEDVELTEDELSDSRTAQVFAVCRDLPYFEDPPAWITTDDATRALDMGIIDALPDPEEVLETSATWPLGGPLGGPLGAEASGCVWPLVSAQERRPLSCEALAAPVPWAADQVPAGTYTVQGYTFEPALNLWSRRLGVVVVQDAGAAPSAAAALMNPSSSARGYEVTGYDVAGCSIGPAGTQVEVQWAALTEPDTWTTFATLSAATDAADADFTVHFEPPAAAISQAVMFRVVATPPTGDPWTGYSADSVAILPGDGESDPAEVVEAFDVCAIEDDQDDAGETDDGGAPGADGGGCRVTSSPLAPTGVLALFLLLGTLRRRSGPGSPVSSPPPS